jgi:glutamate formiminotransferase/formiminotetrahydrofolate cyclodeaminase
VDSPDDLARLTLAEFTDRLASAEPVPGGGSASAIAGSFAASLLAMVARLSLDRPKYEAYRATNERALAEGDRGRRRLLELADEDAVAYAAFAAARKMPKETEVEQETRDAATRAAARGASDVPLDVVRECSGLLDEIAAMAGRSNLNAASDLEVAARLSIAAAHGAAANVLINLPMVGDEAYAGLTTAELNGLLREADRVLASVAEIVGQGTLREPEAA